MLYFSTIYFVLISFVIIAIYMISTNVMHNKHYLAISKKDFPKNKTTDKQMSIPFR